MLVTIFSLPFHAVCSIARHNSSLLLQEHTKTAARLLLSPSLQSGSPAFARLSSGWTLAACSSSDCIWRRPGP
ncbi:unnamed protein product [Zymoseptoria tritici ST99CH_1E4]|nr:unnamed protein product [Zymoseptoria tritici ST99CH_1E4]